MMVGIFSGTYSSIFIASPVLNAWKEREPSFVRRRERIAAAHGSVPAFADELEMARLDDGEEGDAVLEDDDEVASQREEKPKASAVATVEPEPARDGGEPSSNGEPPEADPAEAARQERNERRRARRQQRRKHGRRR
jgi:SecD/SecF fusion protein